MTPLQYYQQQIASGLVEKDPQQFQAMQELQRIYDALLKQEKKQKKIVGRVTQTFKPNKPIKGLYLWGSVGVGKTFLIDSFFHCLPVKKMRLHFHQFMQQIQNELRELQGQKNPLDLIAGKLAKETSILCFDEFLVSNIADAMILYGLFKALFRNGICLVTTSNTHPDNLYKDGIQRENFLPAIDLIKKNTRVFHMVSHHDYRLKQTNQAGIYFTPLGFEAEQNMERSFQRFSGHHSISTDDITLFGRSIKIKKRAGDTIWFDFIDLVGKPRSQKDFLAISKKYNTCLISNIPVIKSNQNDLITSFINLIDIFYDAKMRVIISAETHPEGLYPKGEMRFEFARAQSRLIEMQSTDYFSGVGS